MKWEFLGKPFMEEAWRFTTSCPIFRPHTFQSVTALLGLAAPLFFCLALLLAIDRFPECEDERRPCIPVGLRLAKRFNKAFALDFELILSFLLLGRSMPKFVKLLLACLICLGVITGLVLLAQRLF